MAKLNFEQKNVVLSGGAGFIGSHLTERLLQEGANLWVIDNFVTGQKTNLDQAHKLASDLGKTLTLIEADITEESSFKSQLPKAIHIVLNLASPASPVDFDRIPIEILRTGSLGTENLLKVAKEHNARFLQASTSEVYGDPLEHPQKETYLGNVNCIGPRGCYDEAKRYAEAMVVAYRKQFDVNTGIFRIFNTYGPRMRLNDGRVVPQFMTQALLGEDISVYGDGKQTRSFLFVDDMVEGICRLIASNEPGPINLGMPKEDTILGFAEKVVALSGSKSKIAFQPLPKDDPLQRRPDISKAQELLQWEPTVELQAGLEKTMAFFKERLN